MRGRKVLLFLDNVSSHHVPELELENVKLVFFPPNTTSVLQPLDAGIIRSVKARYRKRLLFRILEEMESAKNASEVLKSVTVLDAIRWLSDSWKEVPMETVKKC